MKKKHTLQTATFIQSMTILKNHYSIHIDAKPFTLNEWFRQGHYSEFIFKEGWTTGKLWLELTIMHLNEHFFQSNIRLISNVIHCTCIYLMPLNFKSTHLYKKRKFTPNYVNVIHVIKYWMVEYICYNWSSSLFCGGKFLWLHLGKTISEQMIMDYGLQFTGMRLNISGNDWIQK